MTFLFDFDGTLADTLKPTVLYFNQVAAEYNLPPITEADLPALKNLSARELLKKYPLSPWQLLKLTRHIQGQLKHNLAQIPVVEGMKGVLTTLKKQGHTLGVVTSNSQENVELFLAHHHVTEIDFVYSERSLFGKGRVLQRVLITHRLNPQQAIYIGDEVRDIEAAHQAGLKVIAVTWGFNSKNRLQQANPDYLLMSPEELTYLLPVF